MAKTTMEEKYPDMFLSDEGIDRRTCSRVVPMQVLSLGMSRTGTASMQAALNILGIPCYHFFNILSNMKDLEMWNAALDAKFFNKGTPFTLKEWDQLLGHVGAVADVPAFTFSPELIAMYPDAKVVLVEREIEAWYESFTTITMDNIWVPVLTVLAYFDTKFMGPIQTMSRKYFGGYYGTYAVEGLRARARIVYREHYAMVRRVTPKERLLEYELGSGWEPLCTFLGKEIPDVPFPRVNESMAMQERLGIMAKRSYLPILKKLAIMAVTMLVGLLAWFGWWMRSE